MSYDPKLLRDIARGWAERWLSFNTQVDLFTEGQFLDAARVFSASIPNEEAKNDSVLDPLMFDSMAFLFHARETGGGADRYYGPMFNDYPAAKDVTAAVVEHWAARLAEAHHPTLKARYADLLWEFRKTATGHRADAGDARAAIDSYIEATRRDHRGLDFEAYAVLTITWFRRALDLAVTLNDQSRVRAAVDAGINLYARVQRPEGEMTCFFLFDSLYGRKHVSITPVEEARIVGELERLLAFWSDESTPQSFNPWAAGSAAKRLARHRRRSGDSEAADAGIRQAGQAMEFLAGEGNSLMGVMLLQDVQSTYAKFGMGEDAERARRALKIKADGVENDMRETRWSVAIPREELDAEFDKLLSGNKEEALIGVLVAFFPVYEIAKGEIAQGRQDAPVLSLFSTVKIADRHIVAEIGGGEEDPRGQLIAHIADDMSMKAPFLALAFDRLRSQHYNTGEAFLDFAYREATFPEDRRDLLREGFEAYVAGDLVKAVHVLIPQIEHWLRGALDRGGGTTDKPRRHDPRTMQEKTLGEVLTDPVLAQALSSDCCDYLMALLADPRGHNLRNRVCHGLASPKDFNRMMADRVLHAILLLAHLGENTVTSDTSAIAQEE